MTTGDRHVVIIGGGFGGLYAAQSFSMAWFQSLCGIEAIFTSFNRYSNQMPTGACRPAISPRPYALC